MIKISGVEMKMNKWVVYILECSDEKKSLYTGITNNLEKRIAKHNSGKGAKYTRGRLPVKLLKSFEVETNGYALRVEHKIKSLCREDKLRFSLNDYDYKQEDEEKEKQS
jgi:putative endonuclease